MIPFSHEGNQNNATLCVELIALAKQKASFCLLASFVFTLFWSSSGEGGIRTLVTLR
jgi:hypothetical protein